MPLTEPVLSCDPSELWSQLVDGNLKVTEHFNADKRCYLVAVTRPAAEAERAGLTLRERDVLTRTLLGAPQKVTALDLALAPSTVSTHLSQALRKLELSVSASAIPLSLVLLCQAACGDAVSNSARLTLLQHGDVGQVVASLAWPERRLPELTDAEQDVAIALVAGLTKAEIAETRRTSVHTIGKQVSAVFAKVGVRGRFELVRRMYREGGAAPENTVELAVATVVS